MPTKQRQKEGTTTRTPLLRYHAEIPTDFSRADDKYFRYHTSRSINGRPRVLRIALQSGRRDVEGAMTAAAVEGFYHRRARYLLTTCRWRRGRRCGVQGMGRRSGKLLQVKFFGHVRVLRECYAFCLPPFDSYPVVCSFRALCLEGVTCTGEHKQLFEYMVESYSRTVHLHTGSKQAGFEPGD